LAIEPRKLLHGNESAWGQRRAWGRRAVHVSSTSESWRNRCTAEVVQRPW